MLSGIVAATLAAQASAQSESVIVTGSDICSGGAPAAIYGPPQRFDGIMFSFIDGVRFTPCEAGRRCDAGTDGASLDLEWEQDQPVLERVWNGWGYYRIAFEGRRGSRDMSRSCALGEGDFYEIGRVISARRIADR